jgi:hypothetical protein
MACLHTPNGEAARGHRSSETLEWSSSLEAPNGSELPALKGKDQVFSVQLQLLQAHFLELFIIGEIRFLYQFFQPLSVAPMFGM